MEPDELELQREVIIISNDRKLYNYTFMDVDSDRNPSEETQTQTVKTPSAQA